MKKTLLALALVAGLATSASALSFQWSAAGIKFDGAVLKKSSDVTAYLVYLGSGDATYATSYALTESTTADSLTSSMGTKVSTSTSATTNAGKLSTTFSFDFGEYTNGDVFGMVLSYKNGDDTYYNIASSTYTLSGITADNSSPDPAQFSFSYSGPTESSSVKSGGGWTAVPEPSTAALALAGLALLIKRRRA